MTDIVVKWFQSHPEISIVGFFIGLLLAIWSIIIGVKSNKKKKLCYSLTGYNLIRDFSEKLNGLDISFNNKKIKNLTVSKIVLWNNGNITFLKSDIVSADPLKIIADKDISILDFKIVQCNEISNQFSLESRKIEENANKELLVNFDYIDSQQGCVIQIIHNGQNYNQIGLEGKIKGVKKITKIDGSRIASKFGEAFSFTKSKRKNRIIVGVIFIIMAAIFPLLEWTNLLTSPKQIENSSILKYFISIVMLPYLYIGFRVLLRRIPVGLDSFDDRL